MFKKICALIVFSFISMTALGMSTSELTSQLIHLNTQIKAVKLSWQRAEKTLRDAKKTLPAALYLQAEAIAQRLLSSPGIKTTMNTAINQQLEAITLYQAPYKTVNFLIDYFPEKITPLNEKLRPVCMAIANKKYRLQLGSKLTIKAKELMIAIEEARNREEVQLF